MADIPNYLKLVRIPRGETTFYMYPEHLGLEEKILGSKGIRYLANPEDSTRQVFLCAAGDFQFVQKVERSARDKFRVKNNGLLPNHGNMAAHEISMARVAREHARYSDDEITVTFEKPLGYFETSTRRTAIFLYNENLERPKPHADILRALRELESRCVKLYDAHTPLQDARGLYTEDFMWLKQSVIDQLTPRGFAGVVLAKHGIRHNEDMGRQSHTFERDGIQYAFVTDFEFAQPI